MRVIDRLYLYLESKDISPFTFEHACKVANGYVKKQSKGKGSIGSDILERIHQQYIDLSLIWLLTGEGEMLVSTARQEMQESEKNYFTARDEIIKLLREQVAVLEASLADKNKIIAMLESLLEERKAKG